MKLPVFPDGVVWEVRTSPLAGGDVAPHPLESSAVRRATAGRLAEFLTGRWCAREALARLGLAGGPIPQAPDRSPVWPPGVVGSITHCEGFIGAAVARTDNLAGLGFDAEVRRELTEDESAGILTPGETRSPPDAGPPDWGVAVFSAKEAIYKAVHPLVRVSFDFLDVEVQADWTSGTFIARATAAAPACVHQPVASILGRLHITATHVVTSAWLPVRWR